MPFGDWNGDGDVSLGESFATGALIGGLYDLAANGGLGGGDPDPDPSGGGCGCGCLLEFLAVLVVLTIIACIVS